MPNSQMLSTCPSVLGKAPMLSAVPPSSLTIPRSCRRRFRVVDIALRLPVILHDTTMIHARNIARNLSIMLMLADNASQLSIILMVSGNAHMLSMLPQRCGYCSNVVDISPAFKLLIQYTIIQFRSHFEYLNLVEQKSSN